MFQTFFLNFKQLYNLYKGNTRTFHNYQLVQKSSQDNQATVSQGAKSFAYEILTYQEKGLNGVYFLNSKYWEVALIL